MWALVTGVQTVAHPISVADAGSVWPIALSGRAAKAAHNNIHRLGRIFVSYSAVSFRKGRTALDGRRPVLIHHSRPSTWPSGVTNSSIVFPSLFLPLISLSVLPSPFRVKLGRPSGR